MKPPAFNRTLRQLVALPIVLLVLMAGFLVWQIMAAARAQRQLDRSDQLTTKLVELQNLFIDQETGLRGYQLTHDPVMLAPWHAAAAPIAAVFASLEDMLRGNAAQHAALAQLHHQYGEWLGFADAVLQQDPLVLLPTGMNQRGKQRMDDIRATIGGMLRHEASLREQEYRQAARLRSGELVSLFGSAVVVGFILALFTRHHVRAISVSYLRRIEEISHQAEELHKSQQWFRTTLESIGDAVIACDAEGAITFMNAVAETLTGWTLNEAKGQPLRTAFHIVNEQTRAESENPVEKVRRLRRVVGLANHTLLLARDGREFVIDDSAAPIGDGGGEMIGVVLVFRDVTEEQQMQAALAASEKLAVAGRLAASIAHEIHNPLDSVANLHFLLSGEVDADQRAEYLRLAQQELGRTMQISRTMLSLYREPKAPVLLDLRDLIQGVLLLLDRRLQHQAIHLETSMTGAVMVEGFPAELRQVFTNLIVNAIEAAGQRGRISIRMETAEPAEFQGSGAIVEIVDSGPGIPEAVAGKLFQPFFTTKGADGTGLGLWVSMGIVQKHGGSIQLARSESHAWTGACIRVFLPARTLAGAGIPAA